MVNSSVLQQRPRRQQQRQPQQLKQQPQVQQGQQQQRKKLWSPNELQKQRLQYLFLPLKGSFLILGWSIF